MINEPVDRKYVFNFTAETKQKQIAERKILDSKSIDFELMVGKTKS